MKAFIFNELSTICNYLYKNVKDSLRELKLNISSLHFSVKCHNKITKENNTLYSHNLLRRRNAFNFRQMSTSVLRFIEQKKLNY